MSGIELAGLVLGAFPLAIAALEKYGEAARRFGMFLYIRAEYKHWKDDLRFYDIAFKRHLKQLLLPLVFDDGTIKELLLDPGSEAWRDAQIDRLLRKRLNEAHELYMGYITGIRQVLQEIEKHLALESAPVQQMLNSQSHSRTPDRIKTAITKDGRAFQRFKIKFANGEAVRKRLFDRIGDYLAKMEKLLATGDEESRIVQQRNLALEKTSVDSSLCSFWVTANRVFKALASAWQCRCQYHDARLLLQHRESKKAELDITFANRVEPTRWELYGTRVAEAENGPSHTVKEADRDTLSMRPKHATTKPAKSSMKAKGKQKSAVKFAGSSTTVEFCMAKSITITASVPRPISSLCAALSETERSHCGFLLEEECRYYVDVISRRTASSYPSVTLESILKRDVTPQPSRVERFTLSLILASSVIQLLQSPWIPSKLVKSDIHFPKDAANPEAYLLGQPQVIKNFLPGSEEDSSFTESKVSSRHGGALEQLGTILLELCFGDTLERQSCRRRWPAGNTETERAGYDFLAAKEWHEQVNGEAGLDYSDAVNWCLWGHRSSTAETWRQDMLRGVIQPLQRCCDYLRGGG